MYQLEEHDKVTSSNPITRRITETLINSRRVKYTNPRYDIRGALN